MGLLRNWICFPFWSIWNIWSDEESRILYDFVLFVKSSSPDSPIETEFETLQSFLDQNLSFEEYYSFPSYSCCESTDKMTLFHFLFLYHASDDFIEYLLQCFASDEENFYSLNPTYPVLLREEGSAPISILLYALKIHLNYKAKNSKHSKNSKNSQNPKTIKKRLESLFRYGGFSKVSHKAFFFLLNHIQGSADLLQPFLESGLFHHNYAFYRPCPQHYPQHYPQPLFESSMSILLKSKKKRKGEKKKMCQMLLDYGGHFELRTLNSLLKMEIYQDTCFWKEVEECLDTILYENQLFEQFMEMYFPSSRCPLTLNVFYHPTMTSDGQSYEAIDFQIWKEKCLQQSLPRLTSPVTNLRLKNTQLEWNIDLWNMIEYIRRLYCMLSLHPSQNEKIHSLFSLFSLLEISKNANRFNDKNKNIAFTNLWREYVLFKNQWDSSIS